MARTKRFRAKDRRECPSCLVQAHQPKATVCLNCGHRFGQPVVLQQADPQPVRARLFTPSG
jgi:hypothetical protein